MTHASKGILKFLVIALILTSSCLVFRRAKHPTAISLVPSVTETIFAMGAQRHLIAVSDYCDYPPEAQKLPKVGSLLSPSYEKIVELNPDLVFVSLPMQKEVADNLQKLGIKTVDISPESIHEIFDSIEKIGTVLNEEKKAKELRDSLIIYYAVMQVGFSLRYSMDSTSKLTPMKFYIELSNNPLYTVGKNSYLNDYLRAVKMENIFGDVDASYFPVDPERVVERNPDVILILHHGVTGRDVMNRTGWKEIDAVKKGRIYIVDDPDIFLRPGPRFLFAIKELIDIVGEINPPGGAWRG